MPDANARFLITADDKASAQLRKVKANLRDVAVSAKDLAVGIGTGVAALTAGLAAAATKALNFADSIADASEKTAFGTERLQELKFAAEQNGVSFRELEAGLARFTKRLGLARQGGGAALKTYEALGINLKQTNEQVFRQVVATLGAMTTDTDRLALATRLFGDDAQRLAVVFQDGNAGLQAYADEARRLGLILSDELVQGASKANDQIEILSKVVGTQLTAAFVAWAPEITKVTQGLVNLSLQARVAVNDLQGVTNLPAGFTESAELRRIDSTIAVYESRLENLASEEQSVTKGLFAGSSSQRAADLARIATEIDTILDQLEKLDDRRQEILFKSAPLPTPDTPTPAPGNIARLFDAPSGRARPGRAGRSAADREAAAAAAAALRKQQEQLRELQTVIDQVDPVAPFRRQLEALEELKKAFPEYSDIITERAFDIQEAIDKANGVIDEQTELTQEVADQWQELGPVFASAFEDAIVQGKSFSDVLKGLEQDLLRIVTRQLVTEPLGNALAGAVGGASGGIGSFFSGLFKAAGGPIRAGEPYIVGEEGPELVIPRAPGTVLNAKQTAAVGNITINLNGVQDFDSFRRNETQLKRAAQRMVNY